jgi:hypothetical protein
MNRRIPPLDRKLVPLGLFITTPNMDYIPDFTRDYRDVWIRQDGRYFVHDFTLYPQWYFEGTYYMPFVLRKPSAEDLEGHEYALAWYDIRPKDFCKEEGPAVEVGVLRRDLVASFRAMRMALAQKVDELLAVGGLEEIQVREMRHSRRGMLFASVALECAPQNYLMTLLTATSFQRHFLETLACYTYLTKYLPRKLSDAFTIHPVDPSLMGTITSSLDVAMDLNQLGVPVWLVRPPEAISKTMNVQDQVFMRPIDTERVLYHTYPGTICVFSGRPSAVRNRVCQALRLKNIQIPHSAYEMQPGDDHQPVAALMPGGLAAGPRARDIDFFEPGIPQQAVPLPPPPPAVVYVVRGGVNNSINLAKFELPSSPMMPAPAPAWKRALQGVNSNRRNIIEHDQRKALKGYACLDPFVIVGHEVKDNRAAKNLVCWLFVRSKWLSRTVTMDADSPVAMPSPQHWRDFLLQVAIRTGLEVRRDGSMRWRDTRADPAVMESFFDDASSITAPVDIRWGNQVVLSAEDIRSGHLAISPLFAKEMVWDLFEHNFRMELLSLDRVLVPRRHMSASQRSEREAMVAEVVPQGLFVLHRPPLKDEGLAGRLWMDRMEYVEAFRALLSTWLGSRAGVLAGMSAGSREGLTFVSDRDRVERVEAVAYPFYCQTFFEYSGRAPTVPVHLASL